MQHSTQKVVSGVFGSIDLEHLYLRMYQECVDECEEHAL